MMADNTKIEWADATVNYLNGCSVISAGCKNCYAMRLAGTRMKHHPSRAGLTMDTKAGPVWTGETRANEKALLDPLGWKRPRRIFWNAHGDLFHESVPDAVIDRQWAVMALTPQHTHMVLTKRTERMAKYLADKGRPFRIARAVLDLAIKMPTLLNVAPWPVLSIGDIDEPSDVTMKAWPLPNVWLGTSVEDQRAADERIPHLLATPAAVRFLSCEPLLGPVDLRKIELRPFGGRTTELSNRLGDYVQPLRGNFTDSPRINWVIAGGESGPGARPMHPDWARSLRDQCATAGAPFHFKQWGEFVPCIMEDTGERLACQPDGADCPAFQKDARYPVVTAHDREFWRVGKARAGRLLDGRTHDEFPGGQANG